MSSNNVVWIMNYKGMWHVFYSGCVDNLPAKPDYNDQYFACFKDKDQAYSYANTVVWKINKESEAEGFSGVEYGVMKVPTVDTFNKIKPVLDALAKCDKMVTHKDIEDFTNLLIKRIEKFDNKFIATKDYYNMDTICDQLHELRRDIKFLKMEDSEKKESYDYTKLRYLIKDSDSEKSVITQREIYGENGTEDSEKPDLIIKTNIKGMEEIPCKRLSSEKKEVKGCEDCKFVEHGFYTEFPKGSPCLICIHGSHWEDSGGENSNIDVVRQKTIDGHNGATHSDASKPPEPFEWIEHHKGKGFFSYGVDTHIIVKREDLLKWKKECREPRENDKVNTLHKIRTIIKLDYPELRIVKREDLLK